MITTCAQYTLVHKSNPDEIMHLISRHGSDKIKRTNISAIPVFRSKRSAEQFKNELSHRHQTMEWFAHFDNNNSNGNKSILQATKLSEHVVYDTEDICIQEIDFNNRHLTQKLIIHNIAVFYVTMFWYKHAKRQQVVSGHMWLPTNYYSNDIDFAKLIYNRENN